MEHSKLNLYYKNYPITTICGVSFTELKNRQNHVSEITINKIIYMYTISVQAYIEKKIIFSTWNVKRGKVEWKIIPNISKSIFTSLAHYQ